MRWLCLASGLCTPPLGSCTVYFHLTMSLGKARKSILIRPVGATLRDRNRNLYADQDVGTT